MIRVTLRSMRSRKLRTALTVLAIFLGVTMISGTYVLTDQISGGFKDIYDQAYSKIDVTVTRKVAFESAASAYGPVGYLPQSLVATVQHVDGVAAALGYVYGNGAVVIDGKAVATGGAPTIVYSYEPGFDQFEPDKYVQGAPPTQHGQVGIIKQLADSKGLKVGDTIGLTTEQGTATVTISGIFTFADSPSLGGATVVHTTLPDAQQWFAAPGQVSMIYAKAKPGVSADQLATAIRAAVPADATVKTGQQSATQTTTQVNKQFGAIRSVLLVFGGVAVLVGAFIIFNTFSITVAQRLREFALLRTLGASRRQVLWAVVGEALVTALVASVAGLFGGIGLALGLNALFHAAGADIPTAGIGLQARTIVISLAVGVGVTLIAALLPALRATRVPPVAALREGAELPSTRIGRYSTQIAALLGVGGAAFLALGIAGSGTTRNRFFDIAVGVVLVFIAVSMVSKHVVRPLVAVIGWPLQRLSPSSGRLARENSVRNTGRTAATASAMMIGLALVVFVAVFAQSLKGSFVDSFDRSITAQFVITSSGQAESALPGGVVDAVRTVPGVSDVSGIAYQQIQVGGKGLMLSSLDPVAIGQLMRFEWLRGGSDQILDQLSGDTAIVEERTALDQGLAPGLTVTVLTQQGQKATLKIIGEYRGNVLVSGITTSTARFDQLFAGSMQNPTYVLAGTTSSPDQAATQRGIDTALKAFPTVTAYTKAGYVEQVSKSVNQMLLIFYALLAMSVIISLFGIVNTLVLAVYERTREIGMLRAIGTSRSQIRAVVRYESVITSVIGAVLGVALGLVFGYVVIVDLGSLGIAFAVPWTQMVFFLIVAVLAGIVAAIIPARRAARLNILEAIHYE